MSTIAWSFLDAALVHPKPLAKALDKRENTDGGRRPLRSTLAAGASLVKDFKGLPKWAAPTIGAVLLTALIVGRRSRL